MTIQSFPYELSVCKISKLDPALLNDALCFVGKTDEELSLVCRTEHAPKDCIAREDGWKVFRIQGVLDFSLTGILARIAELLAAAGIGIFAVSTYNTDYILVKAENYRKALEHLRADGYIIE